MLVEFVFLQNMVKDFLVKRGYGDRESLDITMPLNLDSLNFLALLLHLENLLELEINDNNFFAEINPETETIESICKRLLNR